MAVGGGIIMSDYERQKAMDEAKKIYAEIADDDKELAEDFLSICVFPKGPLNAIQTND